MPADTAILLVEDSQEQARPFQQLLEHRGYAITVAENGPQAIAAAQAGQPELVIVDLLLVERGDRMDGYQVIQELRARASTKTVGILAWTGHYVRAQDEIRALRLGADAFVSKDVEYGVLEARIEALIRRRRNAF